MVILNLPRAQRFNEENVVLVGLMPGPKEPKLSLDIYLRPIVADLLSPADGKHFQDYSHTGNIYRYRLLTCSSDLPAARRLGGFLSYHAQHGKSSKLHIYLSFLYSNVECTNLQFKYIEY